jgi:hypothetical protein
MCKLPRVPAVIQPAQPSGGSSGGNEPCDAYDNGAIHDQMVTAAPDEASSDELR